MEKKINMSLVLYPKGITCIGVVQQLFYLKAITGKLPLLE